MYFCTAETSSYTQFPESYSFSNIYTSDRYKFFSSIINQVCVFRASY